MKYILIILLFMSGKMMAQPDTTIIRLGVVTKDKKTLVTETEIKGDLEVSKRERYDKARALARIEEIDRQIQSDSMMLDQYSNMLDQLRTEMKQTHRKILNNEHFKDRLLKILDQL